MAAAGGFLDRSLGECEILQQRVVEREAVLGTAADLEPPDLGTGVTETLVHLVRGVMVIVDPAEAGANICQRVGESFHAGAAFGLAASGLKIGERDLGFIKGYIRWGESILVVGFVFVFMRHGGQHNGSRPYRTPPNPYPGGERCGLLREGVAGSACRS